MSKFKRIGLVGRPGHSGVVESLNRLLTFLGEKDLSIVVDDVTGKLIDQHGQPRLTDRSGLGAHDNLERTVVDLATLENPRGQTNCRGGGMPAVGDLLAPAGPVHFPRIELSDAASNCLPQCFLPWNRNRLGGW